LNTGTLSTETVGQNPADVIKNGQVLNTCQFKDSKADSVPKVTSVLKADCKASKHCDFTVLKKRKKKKGSN